MNPNRKPFHADLVVFVACILALTFWAGLELGKTNTPEIQCQKIVPASQMYQSRGDAKYWIRMNKEMR